MAPGLRAVIFKAKQLWQVAGSKRMTVFIIGEFGIDLIVSKKALGGSVAVTPYADFYCRVCLDIAIPVGVFTICSDYNAFAGVLVVANHLEHGMSNFASLATLVSQQEKTMTEQPA